MPLVGRLGRASLAVSAGANVKAVQRLLGHASASMTLDVYSGLFDDDLEAVAGLLDVGAVRARADQTRTGTTGTVLWRTADGTGQGL